MNNHNGHNGIDFNERVKATAFAGGTKARLERIEETVSRLEAKFDSLAANHYKILGGVAVMSWLGTLAINLFF